MPPEMSDGQAPGGESGSVPKQQHFISAVEEAYLKQNVNSVPSQENSILHGNLGERIRYSRSFVPTYQIVVVLVILILAVLHWTGKYRKVRKRWQRRVATDVSNVIGQSAEDAASSRERETGEERLPFLLDKETPQIESLHSRCTPLSSLRAALMYQPPPIPILNKALPSNGTSVFILLFYSLNLFYLFYNCPLTSYNLSVLADRAGILFSVNLPLLYLLSAKNQPIKLLSGHSYESLNIFHRRLGEVSVLLALMHSAGMWTVWYTTLRSAGWTLAFFLAKKLIYTGTLGFLAYALLYFTSLRSFRQRFYELFLVSHVVLQLSALGLIWFHSHHAQPYVNLGLAIFLIDRVVFRFAVKTRQERATLIVLPDQQTVKVSITRDHTQRKWWKVLASIGNYRTGWKPADHVFLTVPSLSSKHTIQAHPFTIASAGSGASNEKAHLDLVIRAQDGFSKDLLTYARTHTTTTVRLDGPYGSQRGLDMLSSSDIALVIAGGSGIAVAYPLICGLLAKKSSQTQRHNIEAGKSNPKLSTPKICLIWTIRLQSHISWLGVEKLEGLRNNGVDVVVAPPTDENERPDVRHLVQDWVKASRVEGSVGSVGVVSCGPDQMNRTVRNACALLVGQGHNVDVEVEKFGW